MESTTIALATPVSLGSITYEKVELRTPNAGELRKARAFDPSGTEGYICSLCSQIAPMPMGAVDKISAPDFARIGDFFGAAISRTSTASASESPT